jgi:hypothetical protein
VSADLLREAAALMRSRAEAATPGPWESHARGGDVYESVSDHGDVVAECGLAAIDSWHIASWHPVVALAAADYLDAVEAESQTGAGSSAEVYDAALALARAYLGRDA